MGYAVVLLGAVAFVAGCFLPYSDYGPGSLGPLSLYRLTVFNRGGWASAGALLNMFAGIVTTSWIAVAGIRGRRWAPTALAAASVVWSLTWIGMLLVTSGLYPSHLVGYWFIILGVVVVVIGTIVVWVSARREVPVEPAATASDGTIVDRALPGGR